jgi:hypothetical protein
MRLKDWELMYGAYLRATSHMRDDTLLKPD